MNMRMSFHRWPLEFEQGHNIEEEVCYSVPPTRAYLMRNVYGGPLLRRYLKALLPEMHNTDGEGFEARLVF